MISFRHFFPEMAVAAPLTAQECISVMTLINGFLEPLTSDNLEETKRKIMESPCAVSHRYMCELASEIPNFMAIRMSHVDAFCELVMFLDKELHPTEDVLPPGRTFKQVFTSALLSTTNQTVIEGGKPRYSYFLFRPVFILFRKGFLDSMFPFMASDKAKSLKCALPSKSSREEWDINTEDERPLCVAIREDNVEEYLRLNPTCECNIIKRWELEQELLVKNDLAFCERLCDVYGVTDVQYALYYRAEKIVKELIKTAKPTDVTVGDWIVNDLIKLSWLDYAVAGGSEALVDMIMGLGIPVTHITLCIAAFFHRNDLFRKLSDSLEEIEPREIGHVINVCCFNNNIDLLLHMDPDLYDADFERDYGYCPVLAAAERGNIHMLMYLDACGLDLDKWHMDGWNGAHYSVLLGVLHASAMEVLDYLCMHGVKIAIDDLCLCMGSPQRLDELLKRIGYVKADDMTAFLLWARKVDLLERLLRMGLIVINRGGQAQRGDRLLVSEDVIDALQESVEERALSDYLLRLLCDSGSDDD